jgi:hypothetical protein
MQGLAQSASVIMKAAEAHREGMKEAISIGLRAQGIQARHFQHGLGKPG